MSGLRESIPEPVLAKAETAAAAAPVNEASNFFGFRETDESTGQNYWFFLNCKENVAQIKSVPTGFTVLYLHSAKPSESWHGEEIGVIEIAGSQFVVFKVFPKLTDSN